MKKMIAMLLASVMAVGTFTTTAFAYTGDDVQKNTPVSTAAQETDAAESTNAGKTDNTDSIEIDPDMQVLPDGYEVSTDADGNLIVTVGGKEYNIGSEKSQKQTGTVVPGITSLHFRSGPGMDQEIIGYLHSGDTVEIVEKCGDWYKVNFNGKTGYAHGKYLNVTDSAKDSSMFSEDALKLFLDLMQSGMSSEDETKSSAALTPEGNMTLVDDIGEEEESPTYLAKTAFALFAKNYQWEHPIRSVTVRAINLFEEDCPIQYDLFTDVKSLDRQERLDAAIEQIRFRFGKDAIKNGVLFQKSKMPTERKVDLVMPTGMIG